MTVARSRFARPVAPGAEGARTVGWWGMVIGFVVLVHLVGGFVVGALYLRSGHATWPPEGIPAPPMLRPVVAAALAVLAAVVTHATLHLGRRSGGTEERSPLVGLAAGVLLGAASVGVLAWAYTDVAVRWDEHAYGSVLWVLGWLQGLVVASGSVGSGVLVVQGLRGLLDGGNDDEVEVLVLYWWLAALTSVAVLVVTHALGPW